MKNKSFKKLMAVMLGTVMVLSLAACGSSTDETETETVMETESEIETEVETEAVVETEVDDEGNVTTTYSDGTVTETNHATGQTTVTTQGSNPQGAVGNRTSTGNAGQSGNTGSSTQTTQPSGGNAGTRPGTSTQPSGGNNGGGSGSTTPTHHHSWAEQTSQVWHDEEGHYEDQQVANWGDVAACNACNQWITTGTLGDHYAVCPNHGGSWHSVHVQDGNLFGYSTQQVYVMDRAGYYETVVVGYHCACGASR